MSNTGRPGAGSALRDGGPAATGVSAAAVTMLGVVAALAVTLDQVVKELSTARLTENEPVRALGGLVYLCLWRNSGAAWSVGSRHTWVFTVVAVAVAGWIGWIAARLRSKPWAVALGLVLGGALGNLGDRLFRDPGVLRGHVVDMISLFGPDAQYFPVFNVADMCLTVGVVLAVVFELTGRARDGSRRQSTS
ncbi:hypothetical protein GCM10010168_18470 [Actinoplanes ianthinogenes]|uniref:Lipoprotein signal peptidase n=2 Tax=Actinoplanes ianthinogenes TaxID=122358 RepID=A0ABM7M786_9ACTN|nr:hypothetical protein Aiant_81460 [Actinoplanes ianthinogenes]GGR02120.1 hypothetical protein GCM10010168_18470 [Actinoplanes ianthinogenes]